MFAAEASNIPSDTGVQMTGNQLTGQFQGALRIREIIPEVLGVIMKAQDLGENDAFDIMQPFSQMSGRSLRERAEDVVGSTRRSEPSLAPGRERSR